MVQTEANTFEKEQKTPCGDDVLPMAANCSISNPVGLIISQIIDQILCLYYVLNYYDFFLEEKKMQFNFVTAPLMARLT